jgi:hypothetical protein
MFKKIFTSAIAILACSTFAISTISISTFAANEILTGSYVRVTTPRLNVRDKDCNKVNSVGQGTILQIPANLDSAGKFVSDKPLTIPCTIGGVKYTFYLVNYVDNTANQGGITATTPYKYVASDFIEFMGGKKFKTTDVKTEGDLNLRDENCKRIKTYPINTMAIIQESKNGFFCKVNGVVYSMKPVQTSDKAMGWMAEIYLLDK